MKKLLLPVVGFLVLSFLSSLQSPERRVDPILEHGKFTDHGVAAPFANNRGIVAAVDAQGRNVVLLWLFDRRGGYGLLMIDAQTGASEQFPMPFDPGGECPFSSIFSSQGKLYTLFNGYFVEFDPKKRAFTFHHKTARGMAMGMTEDDQGRIWAVTYPYSGVVCYDPGSQQLTDYGYVHKENWFQYQRYVAVDDKGWVYFAIGNTSSQIIAFNPDTRETKAILKPTERERGMAYVYRDKNGKVYGRALNDKRFAWYELYGGSAVNIGYRHSVNEEKILTGSQALRVLRFPDGHDIRQVDLINRRLIVGSRSGKDLDTSHFDYTTEGTWVMGVAAAPDKLSIVGGSSFPMRLLKYSIDEDDWGHQAAYGQYNALTTYGQYVFFGSYPGGNLLVWDTKKPYTGTREGDATSNPRLLFHCSPVIHRSHRVLVHPDGKTVIMGGTPEYGYTGGGLLFYNMETDAHVLLTDTEVVVNQSTMSLTALNNGKVLGGTTTAPGTGGEKKAHLAELYIINKNTKAVEWRGTPIPGVQAYMDLATRKDGKVYGMADRHIYFVFDPATKKIVYQKDVKSEFGYSVAEQSPRIFVKGEGQDTYVLFANAIAKIDYNSYQLVLLDRTPRPIRAGGDYLHKKIYYVSGSNLISYTL